MNSIIHHRFTTACAFFLLTLVTVSCQSPGADPVLDYMMSTKSPLDRLSVKSPSDAGWKSERKTEAMVIYLKKLPSGGEARVGVIVHFAPGTARNNAGLKDFMSKEYKVAGTEKFKGRAVLSLTLQKDTPKGPAAGEEILLFHENSKAWIMQIFFSEIGTGKISPETRKAGMEFRETILKQLKE